MARGRRAPVRTDYPMVTSVRVRPHCGSAPIRRAVREARRRMSRSPKQAIPTMWAAHRSAGSTGSATLLEHDFPGLVATLGIPRDAAISHAKPDTAVDGADRDARSAVVQCADEPRP